MTNHNDPHCEPLDRIEQSILLLRGRRVMLDCDLARLYGVTTSRLNEQVKRNSARFPDDFMFRLTREEKAQVVANCDNLSHIKYSPAPPTAFTEHGAVMLASVLASPAAVAASIEVVRAFVRLRRALAAHEGLARRLDELEGKCDAQFRDVFAAIRQLMLPPERPRRPVGFRD